MYKTIYIRKGDESFWSRAEEEAKRKHTTLAKLISDLLRNRVYAGEHREEATVDELVAGIQANADRLQKLLAAPVSEES